MKIRVYPRGADNPYVDNFFGFANKKGLWHKDNSIVKLIFNTDVLHIQWPEAWRWGDAIERLRMVFYFVLLPVWKVLFQIKVINTVHNLRPHDTTSWFAKRLYVWTLKNCDGFVHLTDTGKKQFLDIYPWAKKKQHTTIPHPDYRSQLSCVGNEDARKKLDLPTGQVRVVYFGHVKPYKGVERLIKAFVNAKVPAETGSLWVGGNASDEMKEVLISLANGHSNITLELNYINDTDLEMQVKAADWVVLPYFSGLNSGVAVYSLSCGARALVPDTEVMHELDDLTGGGSFEYFTKDNFSDVLVSLFSKTTRGMTRDVNLQKLDRELIGSKYLEFIKRVVC